MTPRRAIITAFVLVLVGYFILVPWLWGSGAPRTVSNIPDSWPHNQDLPVTLTTSAWHSNFKITQVRAVIDPTTTSMAEADEHLYPMILFKEPKPKTWSIFHVSRLTFPRSRSKEVVVPFARLAAEDKVAPGTLSGYLDVEYTYVRNLARPNVIAFNVLLEEKTERLPFQLRLK